MEPDNNYAAEDIFEGDLITALEYSTCGNYLATGDRNGRVTVLKVDAVDSNRQEQWLPYFQFQSHEPEFDFLKSLEIEGKINQLKFCYPISGNNFLLTTNDKTIKLWKIGPRQRFFSNSVTRLAQTGQLTLPNIDTSVAEEDLLHATGKCTFSSAHAYHINSLATATDMETFVSADDLRINMWRFDNKSACFNLVDIKPDNMEELTEVITSVQCHPQHSNIIMYSSSRGAIKVCDTRDSAICTKYSKIYLEQQSAASASRSFITDILNSISDIHISSDGRYIVSRDYLTIKIWDVNMENHPIKSVPLHDFLRPMLYDLYTSDVIFDKFEVCSSPDGKTIATGSYSNNLKLYHHDGCGLKTVELPRNIPTENSTLLATSIPEMIHSEPNGNSITSSSNSSNNVNSSSSSSNSRQHRGHHRSRPSSTQTEIKLDEKVLHCTWHPTRSEVAVAGKNGLSIYKTPL